MFKVFGVYISTFKLKFLGLKLDVKNNRF